MCKKYLMIIVKLRIICDKNSTVNLLIVICNMYGDYL